MRTALVRMTATALGVPRWLWRSVLRISAWHALFVGAVTMTKSASNAVFLARADPRTLPFLYVAVAVLVAVFTSAAARLLGQLPVRRAFALGIAANAVLLLLAILALELALPGAPAAFYVLGEVTTTGSSILFWARVAEAFSVRDQKRVVGVISAGGMAGAVLGGLTIRALAAPIGVLVPVALGSLACMAALPLFRQVRARPRPPADSRQLSAGARYLASHRYAVGVALLVVLFAATGAAVDFVFRLAAAARRDEAGMAELFGILNAGVGVFVVAFQAGLTGRLLERFGIFAFASLVPALLLCCSFAAVASGGDFRVITAMKGLEMAGAFSLYQSAVTLLYNPLPGGVRAHVRALVDGTVKKGGAALTGLMLAALAIWMPEALSPALVGGFALLALFVLPWLRVEYVRALHDKLGRPRRKVRSGTIDTSDRETQGVLLRAIDGDDAQHAIAALHALGTTFPLGPERTVRLLSHEDEELRRLALARIGTEDHALVPVLLRMVRQDAAQTPRVEAVRALARVSRIEMRRNLDALLADDDPALVAAALEAGLSLGEERARRRLDEWVEGLAALSAPWRREVARLLGALNDARYDAILSSLLHDREVSVQRVAVEAAGREQHVAHLPQLVALLQDRQLRASVRAAIAAFGDAAVPILSDTLDDEAIPLALRIHVPRVLTAIGTAAAARALLFSNPRDDAYLQRRIADRLVELQEKKSDLRLDRGRANEAIQRRLATAAVYDSICAALSLQGDARLRLLRRVVEERRQQNLRIAFQLLGLHRGMDRMMTVFRGLSASESRLSSSRQDALELLDASLGNDPLRGQILALLEADQARAPLAPQVDALALAGSKDPLLRGIARHTAVVLGHEAATGQEWIFLAMGADEVEGEDMSDALVKRIFLLEHVDLFEGIAVDDLVAIAAIAEEVSFDEGQLIYREGDQGDSMFVIVEGEVLLTKAGQAVLHLVEGETLGQVSFLDQGPRPVTARVSPGRPARLLAIDRGALMDLLTDRPGLMHALFALLAQRLRTLIDRDAEHGH